MKKTNNKLWALLIALIALVALCAVSASAETVGGTFGANGDNLTWSYDTETKVLTISGTGEMENYINFPWSGYKTSIQSIVIGEGVERIGNGGAFQGCNNLVSVQLPTTLTYIGSDAFNNCVSLSNIELPNGLNTIKYGAFEGCMALKSITIPSTLDVYGSENAFSLSGLQEVTLSPGLRKINFSMFAGTDLREVVIPNSVFAIGTFAFGGCKNLKTVRMGTNIAKIGYGAFNLDGSIMGYPGNDNSALETIYTCMTEQEWEAVYKNVDTGDTDEDDTIAYYESTTPIARCIPEHTEIVFDAHQTLPGSAVCIYCGRNATDGGYCGGEDDGKNLTWEFDTRTKVLTISGEGAMVEWDIEHGEHAPWYSNYCDDIKTVVIEEGVTTIGQGAMYMCQNISSVSLPEGLTRLGAGAFLGCVSLQTITIPKGVTYGYMAFASSGLKYISFAEGVTTIPTGMFMYLEDLTGITIPNSVETIGAAAFTGCPNLVTIRLGTGVRSIGYVAFQGYPGLWLDDFDTENGSLTQIITCMDETEWATVALNVVDPDDEHAVEIAGYFPGESYKADSVELVLNAHVGTTPYEEIIQPTCTTDGHTDTVTPCFYCNKDASRVVLSTTPALGHNVESVTWTWANDGSMANATGVCTRCEQSLTVAATVTPEAQADGSTLCTATATIGEREFTDTKTITNDPEPPVTDPHPGQDHQVASVTWAWTSDGTGATAIGICALCNQPVSAVATVRVETNDDGSKTCYATAVIGGQTFNETKTISSDPPVTDPHPGQDHQVASVTWAWTSDGTGATAIGICTLCNQPVSAVATVRVETQSGKKTCYAMATLGGQTFTDTKIITIDQNTPKPQTGLRCSMCDMNDAYKGKGFIGILVSLVHTFVHLAAQISHATH